MRRNRKQTMGQREYFAEWLDRTLMNRDISGAEAARAVGVSEGAVSRWRNAKGSTIGLDSCMKLATFLKLGGMDPIRLCVTAGIMRSEDAGGADRLPLPDNTARQDRIRDQVTKILRPLTDAERMALLKELMDNPEVWR